MKEKVINLDPDFNFEEVYKRKVNTLRNLYTLINLDIREVYLSHSFFVDGLIQTIEYPKKLYCVYYREWGNPNWFPLEGPEEKNHYYWTLESSALLFKEQIIIANNLEFISKEEAFDLLDERFSV